MITHIDWQPAHMRGRLFVISYNIYLYLETRMSIFYPAEMRETSINYYSTLGVNVYVFALILTKFASGISCPESADKAREIFDSTRRNRGHCGSYICL